MPNTHLTNPLNDNTFNSQHQALIESLTREIIVGSGTWTTNDAAIGSSLTETQITDGYTQPRLLEIDFPNALLESQFISAKLKNVAFMRADVIVTLKLQCTPFLQGALWLWQKPYDKINSNRITLNEHLRSITSFPGVELNLLDETRTVSFTIPYTNEFQYINPFDTEQTLASVALSVLSPLKGDSDAVKANFTILAQFTNIKLYGHNKSQTADYSLPYTPTTYAQCQGEDEKASKQGIVSSVSNTVADIADIVSDVPIVSKIAKPISWAARAVSKVASFFGFSKTLDLEKVTVYSNVPAKGYTNTEGIDNSVNLSALPDNAITPNKSTFDSQDEMSIAYIAKRPYVIGSAAWKEGQPAGTILATVPVHPCNFSTYGHYRFNHRTLFTGPIGYVASLFRYWRGNMNIKLKFAKTQFHQGRLLVQYFPYGAAAVAPVEEVLSKIIDLSEVTAEGIDISFPTITRNKWLSTYAPYETPSVNDLDTTGGIIVFSVLNSLLGAPTVSTEVSLYGWVTWSDMEFAEPGTSMKVVYASSGAKSQLLPSGVPAKPDDLRLGYSYRPTTANPIEITTSLNNIERNMFNQACPLPVGEIVNSFAIRVRREVVNNSTGKLVFSQDTVMSSNSDSHIFYNRTDEFPFSDENTYFCWIGAPKRQSDLPSAYLWDFPSLRKHSKDTSSYRYFDANHKEVSSSDDWLEKSIADHDYDSDSEPNYSYANESHDEVDAFDDWMSKTIVPDEVFARCQGDSSTFVPGDHSNWTSTMGEIVTSLRALTRRFTPTDNLTPENPTPISLNFMETKDLTGRQSVFQLISWLYRFTAGGVRAKIIGQQDIVIASTVADLDSNKGIYLLDANSASHIQDFKLNPILEVQLPFYSPAELLAVGSDTFRNTNYNNLSQLTVKPMNGNSEYSYETLVAASDDQNFTFLVGPPAFFVGPSIN